MGVCCVPGGATYECSHRESRACFLTWKRSWPASRIQPSHLSCQKYTAGASQSHLKRQLLHRKPVTICQSGSTAGSARTRPAGLTTCQPPISHRGGQSSMATWQRTPKSMKERRFHGRAMRQVPLCLTQTFTLAPPVVRRGRRFPRASAAPRVPVAVPVNAITFRYARRGCQIAGTVSRSRPSELGENGP